MEKMTMIRLHILIAGALLVILATSAGAVDFWRMKRGSPIPSFTSEQPDCGDDDLVAWGEVTSETIPGTWEICRAGVPSLEEVGAAGQEVRLTGLTEARPYKIEPEDGGPSISYYGGDGSIHQHFRDAAGNESSPFEVVLADGMCWPNISALSGTPPSQFADEVGRVCNDNGTIVRTGIFDVPTASGVQVDPIPDAPLLTNAQIALQHLATRPLTFFSGNRDSGEVTAARFAPFMTEYGSPTGANANYYFNTSGNLTEMRCDVTTAPGGTDSWTLRVQKNGGDANLTCTITGAATTCTDLSNTDSFIPGDTGRLRMTPNNTPATPGQIFCRWLFRYTSP
jgi:hypothetical protein